MNRNHNPNNKGSPDPMTDPVLLVFSYIVKYDEPPPSQKEHLLQRILAELHAVPPEPG